VNPQPGLLDGDPAGQLLRRHCGGVVVATEPVVVEVTQPAAADVLAAAARDRTVRQTQQRVGPGHEVLQRLGFDPAPGAFVTKAQASAQQLTLAAGHRADPQQQRAGGPAGRRGVERLFGDPGARPCPPAALAAPGVEVGRRRATRGAARPGRGPVAGQVTGEQPTLLIPLTCPPGRIHMSHKPLLPTELDEGSRLDLDTNRVQRPAAHRYRLPAATDSTALRLSSSRA